MLLTSQRHKIGHWQQVVAYLIAATVVPSGSEIGLQIVGHALYEDGKYLTSISANADGLRDAASRKINHIALPTKYNYKATSVGR